MCNDDRRHRVNDCCFSCCEEEVFVQDKICSDFNITPTAGVAVSQDVFRTNVNPGTLFASGTIRLDTAPAGSTFVVNWRLGGPTGTIVETDTLVAGSSISFTKTGFDTIQVVGTASALGATTPNFAGELCITPRYPID
jgi:hypothetical protein